MKSQKPKFYEMDSGALYMNKGDSRPRHLQGIGVNTGLVRQAWVFLSLALCNLANLDPL